MRFSKFLALILVLVMAMAMTTAAFADETMGADGTIGAFEDPDTPVGKTKVLVLVKNLVGYNADVSRVKAPNIEYTYEITGADVSEITVTDSDSTDIHQSGNAVTVQVNEGVGTPGISSISWNNGEDLYTAPDGADNERKITIDFSDIDFGGAGVYRYKITESANSYEASGVTEAKLTGGDTKASHERYIDVYVRYAEDADLSQDSADNWEIYGYTCFVVNSSIAAGEEGFVAKTAGFTSYTLQTRGESVYDADSYYTFNVTIGKIVDGDNYAMNNNKFPFTVAFGNAVGGEVNLEGHVIGDDDAVEGPINPDPAVLSSLEYEILSGAKVKIIGIPCGTKVTVNEENNVTGAIYSVTSDLLIGGDKDEDASTADESLAAGDTSTAVVIETTADAADKNVYEIAVTNTLLTISPTGVIVRYAPYILVLFGGILILVLGLKLMNRSKKNDEA